jgi:hypothetical protein
MDNRTNLTLPRGIRNNNPGNLRSDVSWAFMTGGDSGGFAIFDDSIHGLRALAKDLTNKINADGLTTITGIISKYAPPSENNTAAYIQSVVDDTNLGPDQVLSADAPTLALLMRAIVNHENGESFSNDYVSDADIASGIAMIGLSPAETFPQR